MNSYVSVEEPEIPCDDFDTFVISASNFCENSSDSEKTFEKENSSNAYVTPPENPSNSSPNTNLLPYMERRKRGKNKVRGKIDSVGPNSKPKTGIGAEFQFGSDVIPVELAEECGSDSFNFNCLPLETVLMNYPEGINIVPLSEKLVNSEHQLFDSDLDDNSFDGFSDDSYSSFEGFSSEQPKPLNSESSQVVRFKDSHLTLSPRKLSPCVPSGCKTRSGVSEISCSFGTYQVKHPISRYNSSKSNKSNFTSVRGKSKTSQNYSKSPTSPVYSSSSQKLEEKANGSRAVQPKSKKEKLSVEFSDDEEEEPNNLNLIRSKVADIVECLEDGESMNIDDENLNNLESSLSNINLFHESDTDSFEGFQQDKDSDLDYEEDEDEFIEDKSDVCNNDEADSDVEYSVTSNKEEIENVSAPIDSSDFIGEYCNKVGCTISWLESRAVKTKPVQITNGIIFELSEFAKKIAWEPTYVAEWLLRLKGHSGISDEILGEDMKKINSVLKRRKAVCVNFSAFIHKCKSKLSAFDNEPFELPSFERLKNNMKSKKPKFESHSKLSGQKLDAKEKTNKNQKSFIADSILPPSKSSPVLSANKNKSIDVSKSYSPEYIAEKNDNLQSVSKDKEPVQKDSDNFLSDDDSLHLINSDDSLTSDILKSDDDDLSYLEKKSELNSAQDTNKSLSFNDETSSMSESKEYGSYSERKSSKGRVRKLTPKAQESYSRQYNYIEKTPDLKSPSTDQSFTPNILKIKSLHPIFKEDKKPIGPHCSKGGIDINLLNSYDKAMTPITNGIVYELYHFFREKKASLTSLVHTLYRLKDIPLDKSHIIATMAKIHGMVKIIWNDSLSKNEGMPYEDFDLPGPQMNTTEAKTKGLVASVPTSNTNTNQIGSYESPVKKQRLDPPLQSSIPEESREIHDSDSCESANLSVVQVAPSQQEVKLSKSDSNSSNKAFDLNSTKGFLGKITRGDIVYLYTKWLKKKMEGQTNVFVTDLSKDVEDLIIERQVNFMRIPVGTLMSSSVKLFEEFRKLSKINMEEAKTYLLEDWLEDVQSILNTRNKDTVSSSSSDNENIKVTHNWQSSIALYKQSCKNGEAPLSEALENPSKSPENSLLPTKNKAKPLVKNISDDHEVEKIVGYRIVKIGEESVTEYRIRWLGFTSKDDSWINEADLNCPGILANFWEALNRQRSLKAKKDESSTTSTEKMKAKKDDSSITFTEKLKSRKDDSSTSSSEKMKAKKDDSSITLTERMKARKDASSISLTEKMKTKKDESSVSLTEKRSVPKPVMNVLKPQENVSPFIGRDGGTSQRFFNIMIQSLKPNLVDYQHEENNFSKRVKITKGDILNLFDNWCQENQEHLLTGGNQKVDVDVLISNVKELMEAKKVRNFNPNCIIDVCYRMSLMKAKLKDPEKVKEYMAGDFLELMQISQKHQETVRWETLAKVKKMKQDKLISMSHENNKLNEKRSLLANLENESLIIANYLKDNLSNESLEDNLKCEIAEMKKVLSVEKDEFATIESLKRQHSSTVKEFEACGVNEDLLDELLSIGLKIT